MKYTLREVKEAVRQWSIDSFDDNENNTKEDSEFYSFDELTRDEWADESVKTIVKYLNK